MISRYILGISFSILTENLEFFLGTILSSILSFSFSLQGLSIEATKKFKLFSINRWQIDSVAVSFPHSLSL